MKNLYIILMILFSTTQESSCMNLFSPKKQLFKAFYREDYNTIEKLITKNPRLANARDDLVRTPLHRAVWNGKEYLVTLLLDKNANTEAQDGLGCTPLHDAVDKGNESLIMLLLDQGANIEAQDSCGRTPLHWAIRKENELLVRLLLDWGAYMDVKDNQGKIALNYAQKRGCQDIINLLKEKQLSENASNTSTSSSEQKNETLYEDLTELPSLHWAVSKENESLVKLLLKKGTNIEAQDEDGDTPLHWAVYLENESMVKLLLEKGANVEAQKYEGMTPLHLAISEESESLVSLLLSMRANIEAQDKHDSTPLHRAVFRKNESLVKLLLEKGATMEVKDNEDKTPLKCAQENGCKDIIALFKKVKLIRSVGNKIASRKLLFEAIEENDTATVKKILSRYSELIYEAEDYDHTPLCRAVSVGNESLVNLCLDKGALIEAKDKRGRTPLHIAVYKNDEAMVGLLLHRSANMRSTDNSGKTPLDSALEGGNQAIIQLIMRGQELISTIPSTSTSSSTQKEEKLYQDVPELSPLHQAVQHDNYSKVQDLILQGANINHQTQSGVSCLMLACASGFIDIVRFLLDRGADKDLKDNKGEIAFAYARSNSRQAIMKLLREQAQYEIMPTHKKQVFVYGQITTQGASSTTSRYADLKLLPTEASNIKY